MKNSADRASLYSDLLALYRQQEQFFRAAAEISEQQLRLLANNEPLEKFAKLSHLRVGLVRQLEQVDVEAKALLKRLGASPTDELKSGSELAALIVGMTQTLTQTSKTDDQCRRLLRERLGRVSRDLRETDLARSFRKVVADGKEHAPRFVEIST